MYLTAVYVDDDVSWNFTEGVKYLVRTNTNSKSVVLDDLGNEWDVIQTGYDFYTMYGNVNTPLAMFDRL